MTLDKTGFNESSQYHDIFEESGTKFLWDSQSSNTQETPVIALIINEDAVIVFVRLAAKIRSRTQPFTFVGKLTPLDYDSEKPVQMIFEVSEHVQNPPDNLCDIYGWEPSGKRKLRPVEVEEVVIAEPKSNRKRSGSGQGRLVDPAKKKAIELRAMAVATEHYEKLGYAVEDTSRKDTNNTAPFDLLCVRDSEERKVEVKGTTQSPQSVNVTANEVKSARDSESETDLFVLHGINAFKESGEFRAEGGESIILTNWVPEDEQLTPTAFIYRLP